MELYASRAQVLLALGRHEAASKDLYAVAALSSDASLLYKAHAGLGRIHQASGGGLARPHSQPPGVARGREIETPIRTAHAQQQRYVRPLTVPAEAY